MSLLVIIPAHNEEASIASVIDEVWSAQPEAAIVVIDDGSIDDTQAVAEGHGATVLRLPVNLGIGGAVQTGFKYAGARGVDAAVQIDGDGQHIPRYIDDLIQPLQRGEADVVIGSRFLEKGGFKSTFTRRMGISVFRFMNSMFIGQKITDNTSGFRAYNARAIQFLADNYPHDYPEPEAVILLGRNGFRIAEIPVTMREREHGRSSITHWRPLYYMIKVLLASSMDLFRRPIQGGR